MKKKSVSKRVPLFSLSSKHNAVRSRHIDQGHLGQFTEVDQFNDVGRSSRPLRVLSRLTFGLKSYVDISTHHAYDDVIFNN